MNYETIGGYQVHKEIYSINKFIERALKPHDDPSNCSSLTYHSGSFVSTTLEQTAQIAKYGWRQGYEQMKSIVGQLEEELRFPTLKEVVEPCKVGSIPNVPLYLMHHPCSMLRLVPETIVESRKFISMQIGGAISGGFGQVELFWKGAVAVALANALERSGYSVEINLDLSSQSRGKAGSIYIPIKPASSPTDLDAIAFFLAHPGCLRRLGFSVMEHFPMEVRAAVGYGQSWGGYGCPVTLNYGADIFLHMQSIRAYNLQTAKECFNTEMAKLSALFE